MLYPEGLKGVLVTPPLYGELEIAYNTQLNFLRSHPGQTHSTAPLSPEIGSSLFMAHAPTYVQGLREYYGITDLVRAADAIAPPSGIGLDPEDVEHIVESIQRQRSNIRKTARECQGTLPGLLQESLERAKTAFLLAMHDACMLSRDKRQQVTKEAVGAVVIDVQLSTLPLITEATAYS